jgi:hypothetical protein
MYDSIQDRVYALVAEERGVRREKLHPLTTLSHDLGMEGDDAVEFFRDFGEKFAVDLKQLDQDWHCYFGPEGVGFGGILFVLFPTLILAFLLGLAVSNLSFMWAVSISFVLWMGAVYCWQRFRPSRDPEISIQDLVDCAKAGRWTKELPADARARRVRHATYGGLGRWFTS